MVGQTLAWFLWKREAIHTHEKYGTLMIISAAFSLSRNVGAFIDLPLSKLMKTARHAASLVR